LDGRHVEFLDDFPPRIGREDTARLCRIWRAFKDNESPPYGVRNRIVVGNLRFTYRVAREIVEKYYATRLFPDLFAEAALCMIVALDHYDPDVGEFSSYMGRAIKNHITKVFLATISPLSVPGIRHKGEESIREVDREMFAAAFAAAEPIPHRDQIRHESDMFELVAARDSASLVRRKIDEIGGDHAEILKTFYGIGREKAPLTGLARELGVSHQRVYFKLSEAEKKLKHALVLAGVHEQ
jgi:RNA polymerase sigma factor (sigma-70 family)